MQNIFKRFKDLPQEKIVVGGTNGKGETCWRILSNFEENNKRVALFTSPHVIKINERFYFDGKCKDEILRESLDAFESLYPQNNINLSFYELTFWCFLWILQNKYVSEIDVVIFEVGLGGRLDAVNLIDSNYAVITSISRDHTEFLGNRYEQILKEKLGITRKGRYLFFNTGLKYLKKIAFEWCEENSIIIKTLDSLACSYTEQNSSLAQMVCREVLQKNEIKINHKPFLGIARFQTINIFGKEVLLNNSHNLDGHRQYLKKIFLESQKKITQSNFKF